MLRDFSVRLCMIMCCYLTGDNKNMTGKILPATNQYAVRKLVAKLLLIERKIFVALQLE